MIWLLLAVIVIFVSPFLIAKGIARLLRMKDVAVRLGIVLLATFLGLTPFAAQFVLGVQEQREYKAALAEWEQKLEQRLSNSKITDEGLQKLRQTLPQLQVIRGGEGDDEVAAPAAGSTGATGAETEGGPALPGSASSEPPAGTSAPEAPAGTPANESSEDDLRDGDGAGGRPPASAPANESPADASRADDTPAGAAPAPVAPA